MRSISHSEKSQSQNDQEGATGKHREQVETAAESPEGLWKIAK